MNREEVRKEALKKLKESRKFQLNDRNLAIAIKMKEEAVTLIMDGTQLNDEDRCILICAFHELMLCAKRHEPNMQSHYQAQRDGHHRNLHQPLPIEEVIKKVLQTNQPYPNADLFHQGAPTFAPPMPGYNNKTPTKTRSKL